MVFRLRWTQIAVWILSVILVAGIIVLYTHKKDGGKEVSSLFEEQSLSEQLLVYLFVPRLQAQSDLFYEPYYTLLPTIPHYFTTVKAVEEAGANICITFALFPYMGPHNPIGEDEVMFCVDHSGKIVEVEFKHLKNDALPDSLNHMTKGTLPPISE